MLLLITAQPMNLAASVSLAKSGLPLGALGPLAARKSIDLRFVVLGICLCVASFAGVNGFAAETEADLLAKLQDNNTSFHDKTAACKRLAVIGTEAAVPVLAALLDDDQLAHYARYGLEPIPSAKVDTALLTALSTLQGKYLIGVIQSIGNRGKPEAISQVATKLDDEDREVAKSAAHCIARLGTPLAAQILSKRLSPEFAPACLRCGKQLAQQGHKQQAVEMLDNLSQHDGVAEYVRLAALLQTIELRGPDGLQSLAEALASDDDRRRNTGLRTARLIDAADASKVARTVMKDASPDTTARLLILLGDLRQSDSLPTVIQAAESDDESTRVAALEALASLGGARQVALLLDAAADDPAPIAQQAIATLVALKGRDIDNAILELLGDQQRRAMVIRAIGQRRIAAAVPQLLEMIDGPHQLEVIAALGGTISLDELDLLGKKLDSQPVDVRKAVKDAFHAACYRMPDRAATVEKLTQYLSDASEQTVQVVMDELRQIGGPEALAEVTRAATGNDVTQREYATQALGEWLDTSAASVLLEMARSEGESKYGIRGIRGYIRLARQFSMPAEQRAQMCRNVLKYAKRTEDKKLVLEVLKRNPSIDMLQIAVEVSKDDALKDDATSAAKKMAPRIKGNSKKVQALLAELGIKPSA